ncbi:hypothetical protein, partial [Burkholderia contaminans]|uniref:hypothetical protein n=1 Tax=Burkholderia contaminans TaxID=488447 RepID=UPI001C613200
DKLSFGCSVDIRPAGFFASLLFVPSLRDDIMRVGVAGGGPARPTLRAHAVIWSLCPTGAKR